jgi:hypothetical protein
VRTGTQTFLVLMTTSIKRHYIDIS